MLKQNHTFLLIIFLLSVLFLSSCTNSFTSKFSSIPSNSQNSSISNITYNLQENLTSNIELRFCPEQDCNQLLVQTLKDANSQIKCAFYELDETNISQTLFNKSNSINISLIIDDNYLEENGINMLKNTSIKIYSDENRGTRYNNYMHNKFCVIDNKIIITGSTNPTENGLYKNNNNIIKIESKYLAKNYENEFDQMADNFFGYKKNSVLEYNNITLKFQNETYLISSYMCPQDKCAEQITTLLDSAQNEILFASFTLTNNEIENKLVEKAKEGINIKGLIEKRNLNIQGSNITLLNQTFPIHLDTNKYNMHHKFFIIDEKWVITGSMNPTDSGANYNDENILIIESAKLAKLYKQEFQELMP